MTMMIKMRLILLCLTPLFASATGEDVEPLIIGGVDAQFGEFEFLVHGIDGELCGGSLIAPDIVLTAAHCQGAFDGSTLFVGSADLYGRDGGERLPIEFLSPHPEYVPGPEDNDIMLIKLAAPSSSPMIQLNFDSSLPQPGESVTAIGFGYTAEAGPVSDALKKVDVKAVGMDTCQKKLPGVVNAEFHLCAGMLPEGGKDSCNGDSGGPLLSASGDLQYGVVTFGSGCARPDRPGVYISVSYYRQWIASFVCEHSTDSSSEEFCRLAAGDATLAPTNEPTKEPTVAPTGKPTAAPTFEPTRMPSREPTVAPSSTPTTAPSIGLTTSPSAMPSAEPTLSPTRGTEEAAEAATFQEDEPVKDPKEVEPAQENKEGTDETDLSSGANHTQLLLSLAGILLVLFAQ